MDRTDHCCRQLEAYLDGLLSGPELVAFERELQTDAALRAAVQQQRQIDRSLRSLMKAACPPALAGHQDVSPTQHAPPLKLAGSSTPHVQTRMQKRPWLARLAVAAALLAGAYGVWSVWSFIGGGEKLPIGPARTMVAYYQQKVDDGFHAYWKCENDQEFAQFYREKFNQPLQMRPLPANCECVGIDYARTFSPDTAAVLVNEPNAKVIVLIDRAGKVQSQAPPLGCKLHTFTRDIGGLRLVEITPLTESTALDYFFNPDSK